MTENAQTEQNAGTEAKPTLEELYSEYNVGTEQEAAVEQTEQEPVQNDEAAIREELAAFRRERAADKAERARARDEADFNNAVAALGKEAELEGKDLVIKGYLLAKANEDQRLRTIWDNRTKNPQAWDKALKILASEVKDQFAVSNPQLEENQRAMEESQRTSSSVVPPKNTFEQEAMKMTDAEFQAKVWGRLTGRG